MPALNTTLNTALNTAPTPVKDPIAALATRKGRGVLALIIGTEGPSYRPVGAVMAFLEGGARVGTLSSGCIEGDLEIHAQAALDGNKPLSVIYGRGSPFIDIQLPCGGGLEILLLPDPPAKVLAEIVKAQAVRAAITLVIDVKTGALELQDAGETGLAGGRFLIRFTPPLNFYVFGKGVEASTFAALVYSAGYGATLLSPDRETLEYGAFIGCETRHLKSPRLPDDLTLDHWSAVVLFFHDHEWEPPILAAALLGESFYIGSQGSQRARDLRLLELESMGIIPAQIARLHGPIGLVPSARDARTLAVSVLAEVLSLARGP